jgi:hypothetical protein
MDLYDWDWVLWVGLGAGPPDSVFVVHTWIPMHEPRGICVFYLINHSFCYFLSIRNWLQFRAQRFFFFLIYILNLLICFTS